MKVAIIGGGLVGRIAAWATMQAGHSPRIFDRMRYAKAPRGFVYEHQPLFLPLRRQRIHVLEQGTAEGYAQKVYGDPKAPVSFGQYAGIQQGYDPQELLNCLNGLQDGMVNSEANFADFDEIRLLFTDYERVIFTLPLNKFFKGTYKSTKGSVGAWKLDPGEDLENFCVYNGSPDVPWHRSGSMFGFAFREYATMQPDHFPIVKVVSGTPPPELVNVLFTGRYGRWDKEWLSHHTYFQVLKWLS